MDKNKSQKTKLIIGLLILIAIIAIMPIKDIIMKPSITGAVTFTSVYVRGLQQNQSCVIQALDGWNLISTPCLPSNNSIAYALSNISGSYTSIHYYDSDDSADSWKSYNSGLPSWVSQDLSQIDEKKGYWLYSNGSSNISIVGTIIIPNAISLKEGWNLIGYPSTNISSVSEALSSIEGSYTIILLYNSSDKKYYYYNYSQGNGTLGTMRPYYGYWINATQEDTLFIN